MEYMRCSYLVTHRYNSEALQNDPPLDIQYDQLVREVKVDNPMITMREFPWEQIISSGENMQRNQENEQANNEQVQNFDMLGTN